MRSRNNIKLYYLSNCDKEFKIEIRMPYKMIVKYSIVNLQRFQTFETESSFLCFFFSEDKGSENKIKTFPWFKSLLLNESSEKKINILKGAYLNSNCH